MNWEFVLSLVASIGGAWWLSQKGVWWLSQQFKDIGKSIDRIEDLLREYVIRNDAEVAKQKDRITALKYHTSISYKELNGRLSDVERFLFKSGFQRKIFYDNAPGTQGDFEEEIDWTDIK